MLRRLLGFTALIATSAAPQPLTTAERDRALRELESSRKALLDAVSGLTPAQWMFKPAPDRWSIVECVEHVALTEDSYFALIREKLLKSEPPPEKRFERSGSDDDVLRKMPDRSSKRKTSEALEPKGKSPKEALEHFERSRQRFIAYVRSTSDDLRSHFRQHRATGVMDGYQWVLLAAGHTLRHLDQIREVMRDPKFPPAGRS